MIDMTTEINGHPAPWTPAIWQLWYTYVDHGDPKLYDDPGLPVLGNYMDHGPGKGSICFAFVLRNGRRFHCLCMEATRVHAFNQGRMATALCGSSNHDDGDEPASENWDEVSCAACLTRRPV